MRLTVQRVANAKVEVDNKIVGEIDKGFLVSAYKVNCDTINNSPSISFIDKFIFSFSSSKTLKLHNFFAK